MFFKPVLKIIDIEALEETTTNDGGEEVKNITEKAYKQVQISLFSSSPCNIRKVNANNKCSNTDMIRARVKAKLKSYWSIDRNKYCQVYIGTYSCIY